MKTKSRNSLFFNIARVLSANFWVAIIGFIGSFVFPKILTIESYAMYQTFTLYVGYIGILHLGFPSGMVIKYAGGNYGSIDKKQYKSEIFLLLTILSVFTLLFSIVFLYTMDRMIGYIIIAVIPVGVINSYKSLYQAWNKFKLYTQISMLISTMIPLCAIIYYIVLHDLPSDIYISIYLIIYWIIAVFILFKEYLIIKEEKCSRLLSKENWEIEKFGIALVIGNYINILLVSVDKQFIKWFFGTTEFAFYSFAMSMQALMTVFITSVAQPLFPAMAKGGFSEKEYNKIKSLLIVFGSFSGCAYFVTSIIVKLYIPRYIGSLNIVGIYFVVFPAMAVINCLYINLYKIMGKMKSYILTLIGILITAIILIFLSIFLCKDFTGVALATTLTYYIWFMVGIKQFKFLNLTCSDIMFLVIYIIGFFVITQTLKDYIGFMTYFIFIVILMLICYRDEFKSFLKLKKNF